MTIQEFIKQHHICNAYDFCNYWKGFKVYEIWEKGAEEAVTGYPQFALEKDGNIREALFSEVLQIMDIPIDD